MNGLVWFRNDLRITDNNSLYNACADNERVIGIYCLDPRYFETTIYGFKKTEKFRAKFLLESLTELRENLAEKNISLLVYYGYPEKIIPAVCAEHQISTIYSQKEWTSEEVAVENEIRELIPVLNWKTYYDQFLFHPDDVPFESWRNFRKYLLNFESFWKRKFVYGQQFSSIRNQILIKLKNFQLFQL